MDKMSDMDLDLIHPLDGKTFLTGPFQGKTYQYVRQSHYQWLFHIISRSAGSVIEYYEFIEYCLEYLVKA